MKQIIDEFLKQKKIAIAGVSAKADNWGKDLVKELLKSDYEVYAVNPNLKEFDGIQCYASVKDLPKDVENIIMATSPRVSEMIASEMQASSIKRVWFHRGMGKGSYSQNAFDMLKEKNIEIVFGLCPMMFFNGKGIHKFHFKLRKLFGGVPGELFN